MFLWKLWYSFQQATVTRNKTNSHIEFLFFQLIFSGEYTKAMDQDWHTGHFACWNCNMSLTGHRYILRDEHPFCIKCYENLFANSCEDCKTPIGTDSKVNTTLELSFWWGISFSGLCFRATCCFNTRALSRPGNCIDSMIHSNGSSCLCLIPAFLVISLYFDALMFFLRKYAG